MMKPLQIILLVLFLQLIIQAQDLLILVHFHNEFWSNLFDFLHELQSIPFDVNININCRFMFETMGKVLILHSYRIYCVYELLLS